MENNYDHLRAMSHKALRGGQFDEAERVCWKLWNQKRRASDLANYLQSLICQGKAHRGIETIQSIRVEELSKHPDLCLRSAETTRLLDRKKATQNLLELGIRNNPDNEFLLLESARIMQEMGHFSEAKKCLDNLTRKHKKSFSAWFNLGYTCCHLSQVDEALQAFEMAQELNPEHTSTAANRVTLLTEKGKINDAKKIIGIFKTKGKSTGNDMQAAEAGLLMKELNYCDAGKIFFSLCEKDPTKAIYWLNLAACMRAMKLAIKPDKILRRGLVWNPKDIALQNAWFQSLGELCYQDEAKKLFKMLDIEKIKSSNVQLYNLLFLAVSNSLISSDEQKDITQSWEKEQTNPNLKELWKDHIIEPWNKERRRLRIGYLSSDYCNHPVGRFLLPVIKNHDESIVETWGLHTGQNWDEVSRGIKNKFDHWIDLSMVNDEIAARVISDQKLDVLVELGGFTGNSRIKICLYEPSMIQMSYLGYPGPTNLKTVPWWIGDKQIFHNLPNSHTHRLASISGGYMTMQRPHECPDVCATGLEHIRFGSFNHSRKLSSLTIDLWCKVLKSCANAQLVLKSFSFQNEKEKMRTQERFELYGLSKQRVLLLPATNDFQEHLSNYNNIDIALDPTPYGGATTTAEALWMGVPVITLRGNSMAANLAASILSSANCSEWIFSNIDEYIEGAKALANAGPRGIEQRELLIRRIKKSKLNDPRRVSRELETIFSNAVKEFNQDVTA